MTTTWTERGGRGRMLLVGLTGLLTAVLGAGALTVPAGPAGGAEPTPLVTPATTWRYLADDTDPGSAWAAPAFDDSAWRTGRGGFGGRKTARGETPEFETGMVATTHLQIRPDGLPQPVRTYFFRTTFEVTAAHLAAGRDLVGDAYVDDAARIYVNGREVVRYLVEPGTPTLSYDDGVGGNLAFTIPLDAVREGTNTLAVSVHQGHAESSDIWWSLDRLAPAPVLEPDPPGPQRIVLTPTQQPATSQTITWLAETAGETAASVEITPAAGGAVREVAAVAQGRALQQPNTHFSATVTGLQPGVEYRYRVGSAAVGWSQWHTFTTADPTRTDFEYVYYGDAQMGLDSTWPAVVRMAEQTAPDSIGSVHAGDLVEAGNADGLWQSWFRGMRRSAATTNVLAAPGNHEYSGDRLLQSWKAHFEYPANHPTTSTIGDLAGRGVGDTDVARQYDALFDHWAAFARDTVYFVDYQGVRFITVNATRDPQFLTPSSLPACSSPACPAESANELWIEYQAAWLDHVLQRSPSRWNVVTFHQPVLSASGGRDEPVLRKHWLPVLQKHDVDLVQMGHDHVYSRGYLDTDRTTEANVTDGPVYVVSNSGSRHYHLAADEANVWTANGATQVVKGARITTFQVVSVSRNALVYRSYLAEAATGAYTVPARNLEVGALIDMVTVHKTDSGLKRVVEDPRFPPPPRPTPKDPKPTATPTVKPPKVPAEPLPSPKPPKTREPEPVTQQPTSVTIKRARLKAGQKAAVWVRASTAGRARITLRLGGKKVTRTVSVRSGTRKKVSLGRVTHKLLRRSGGKARVVVVLRPADPKTYLGARTTRKVRVARR